MTAATLPVLRDLSMARVLLEPGATRAPHWCANASELAYCLSGKVRVSVLDGGGRLTESVVEAGSSFYVESGSLHYVENVGADRAEFVAAINSERPEEFGLGEALEEFGDDALNGTYNLSSAEAVGIRRRARGDRLGPRPAEPDAAAGVVNGRHRTGRDDGRPRPARHDEGVGLARGQYRPVRKDISMYAAPITDEELRGPHWHPMTAEMGFIRFGGAQLTVMTPGGGVDTEDVAAGDIYFVPPGFPHRIAKAGTDDDGQLLTFFDRPAPPRSDTAHRPVPLRPGSLPQRGRHSS